MHIDYSVQALAKKQYLAAVKALQGDNSISWQSISDSCNEDYVSARDILASSLSDALYLYDSDCVQLHKAMIAIEAAPSADAPKEEFEKWDRAKEIVEDQTGQDQDEFSTIDWGLTTHIWQGMGESWDKESSFNVMFSEPIIADDTEFVYDEVTNSLARFDEDGMSAVYEVAPIYNDTFCIPVEFNGETVGYISRLIFEGSV